MHCLLTTTPADNINTICTIKITKLTTRLNGYYMKNSNQILNILLAISILALSGVASAAKIEGAIKFGGSVVFVNDDPNTSVDESTFATNFVNIDQNRATVIDDPTGTFASYVSWNDVAVYNDFAYDPFTTVSPLWSIGGFSFDLTEITYIDESYDTNGNQFLNLSGNGNVYGNGFEITSSFWTFNANGDAGTAEFAFSSTNVPEPGVALLLSVGLIGFGISRKLRKTA